MTLLALQADMGMRPRQLKVGFIMIKRKSFFKGLRRVAFSARLPSIFLGKLLRMNIFVTRLAKTGLSPWENKSTCWLRGTRAQKFVRLHMTPRTLLDVRMGTGQRKTCLIMIKRQSLGEAATVMAGTAILGHHAWRELLLVNILVTFHAKSLGFIGKLKLMGGVRRLHRQYSGRLHMAF